MLLPLSVVGLEQEGLAFILDFGSTRKHGGGQVGTMTGKRMGVGEGVGGRVAAAALGQ